MAERRRQRTVPAQTVRTLLFAAAFFALAASARAQSIVLAWDPNPEPNITAYRVFVGTSPGSYTQTYDLSNYQTYFVYPASGSRVYYFAVAAQVDDAVFGPRSAEVSASATSGRSLEVGGAVSEAGVASEPAGAACADGCLRVSEIASGLVDVSSLTSSRAGVMFLVEAGRQIRVIASDQLAAKPALAPEDGVTLKQVVVDPEFDTTGHVFVSEARPIGAGLEMSIVRYRFLAGSLGEPAAIVTGLPLPRGTDAPFTIDPEGQLFVATGATPSGERSDAYAQSVLVFTRDGGVPQGRPAGSPVVARGPARPVSLQWDPVRQVLWLAGQDQNGVSTVATIAPREQGPGTGLVSARQASLDEFGVKAGDRVTGLAVSTAGDGRLVLTTDSAVIAAAPGSAKAQSPEVVAVDGYGQPAAVTTGPGGMYVAARGTGSTAVILRIVPAQASSAGR